MPTCEIITIGSELVSGRTLNTNAHFLSKAVSQLDIEVTRHASCRDIERDILDVLRQAYARADLIFVVGGLGPTPDDITRETIAKFFHSGLAFDRKQYARIVRYFKKKGEKIPFITKREAHFPQVATPLLNRFGLALGFYVRRYGKLLIALPGVPSELIGMFQTSVGSLIRRVFPVRTPICTVEARIAGLYETQIMGKLGSGFFKNRIFDFGIYPEVGEVTVRLKMKDKKLAAVLRRELHRKLGRWIYGFGSEPLSQVVGEKFIASKKTLAVAESCTGGLLAKNLTDHAGSSRYFRGGLVAYSNDVKAGLLGISKKLIQTKGAVSREVAEKMAEGIRKIANASVGLSITGIAGPSGGSAGKPVGLVFIALSDCKKTTAFQFRFSGSRSAVRLHAVQKACWLLLEWLKTNG